MADSVADIVNQSLDAIGAEMEIGDIQEGSKAARVALRSYLECLKQVLRAANWEFAKARAALVLLGDASGQTQSAGTLVIPPWNYEYAYPDDCVKARYLPFNGLAAGAVPPGNIQLPPTPPTTGGGQQSPRARDIPAPYAIATDPNYPPATQVGYRDANRKVILCNVPSAELVYIRLMLQPTTWDPLFRAAFVSFLAQEIAMGVLSDKKMARQMRADQIGITKQKILEARAVDGNEVQRSSSISVDWMRARNAGGFRGLGGSSSGADSGFNRSLWQGEIDGNYGGPFDASIDALPFSDGTSF